MQKTTRIRTQDNFLPRVLKGVLTASLVSVASIAGFALALKAAPMTDTTILVINQVLKVVSILIGVLSAVGRGGAKGYLKGALTGGGYMVFGLGLSALASMQLPGVLTALSELAFGGAVGALCGAFAANLPAKRS